MSRTVDQQVVEMRFDNKRFEENVSSTISMLDKLKEKLNLKGASKGMEEVDSAAKRIDMSGLGNAVEAVQGKFSALGIMGVTALMNITNSAVNTGKRMISALTIDPIKSGFSEYETKINSIQTILSNTASKGTTMADVTKVIGELNTYADKTIYNFAEMTRNIGTFTAAGVGLEESATAIQGIANLAAVSGSNSQQASTAMYQLSQAMASGTVKLMDWNSVVNAGMGGQVFQDALKATARAHGVAVDDIIKKQGSFRESLSQGWLTADILTETLAKMTKGGAAEYLSNLTGVELKQVEAAQKLADETGNSAKAYDELATKMAASGKITKEEAMNILSMADNAENAATKVKTFTQLWDTLKESAQSGWSQTWEILVGDFEEAKETLTRISEVIGKMLEASANARNELLQGWKDAGGRTHLVDSLFNIIEAVMSIVKPIKEAFSEIFPPMTVAQLFAMTYNLREFTENLKLGSKASDNLKRTFKGLFAILDIVKQAFSAVFELIRPLFGTMGDLGGGLLEVTARWGDWLVNLSKTIKQSGAFYKAIDNVKNALGKVKDFLVPVLEGVKEFGSYIAESFTGIADNAKKRFQPLTALGEFLKSIFVGLGKVLQKIMPFLGAAASGIGNVVSDVMGRLSDGIQNTNYDAIFDVASGGIMSAIGVFIAKFIKSGGDLLDNAGGFIENLNDILGGVSDALGAFQKSMEAEALKKIAIAIGILAASLFVLSLIDSSKLTMSLFAISTLFAELMTTMSVFSKMGDLKGITKIAAALIPLSAALLIMSVALKIMSTMSWSEMAVGLISLTVGLGALVGAVNLLPESKVHGAAKAIKTMAGAILILAVGIKIMSTMSWSEMGVGLISMVAGLGAMVAAVNLLPKDTAMRAAGLVGLATAMVILGAALKIMATMSWGEVAISLVSLAGSLLILAGAMALMQTALPGAIAMAIIAPALILLASALKIMSGMSWEEVAIGLVTLAGALLIISGAMYLMSGAIPGALALLVVAASLAVLAPVLMLLGSMSLAEIGKSLLMLAGVFAVIGVAALLLAPLVPVIISLAGAMTLLGVACAAIGAGVFLVGAGLTMLAAALAASGGAITAFVVSIISLIPFLLEQIGLGIIKLCEAIAGGAAAICAAATTIILAVVDALVTCVPVIVDGIFVLLLAILDAIAEYTPKIIDAATDIIVAFLDGIGQALPRVIQAGIDLMLNFINGLADGIRNNTAAMINAVNNLMDAVIDAVVAWFSNFVTKGGELVSKLAGGITGNAGKGLKAIGDVIKNMVNTVKEKASSFVSAAKDLVNGLVQGIKDKAASAIKAAKKLASDVWEGVCDFLGIKSPSRKFIEVGKWSVMGLANGLDKYANKVTPAAENVGRSVLNTVSGAISALSGSIENGIDAAPTIRPVLDLSDVRSGVKTMGGMLAMDSSVGVMANIRSISASMGHAGQNGANDDVVSAINKLRKELGNVGNTTYQVNGVTYDDGTNIANAIKDVARYAKLERRI